MVTSTSAPRCQPSLVAADDASYKDMLVMRAQRARCVPDGRSTRGSSRSLRDKPPRSSQVTESAGGRATAPQTSQADGHGAATQAATPLSDVGPPWTDPLGNAQVAPKIRTASDGFDHPRDRLLIRGSRVRALEGRHPALGSSHLIAEVDRVLAAYYDRRAGARPPGIDQAAHALPDVPARELAAYGHQSGTSSCVVPRA